MADSLQQQLDSIGHGDHLCTLYDSTDEQIAVIAPFFVAGLDKGERCLYLAGDPPALEFPTALEGMGIDFGAEAKREAIVHVTTAEICPGNVELSPNDLVSFLEGAVSDAVAEGFSGLRIVLEMAWAGEYGHRRLLEYESLLSGRLLAGNSPVIILCQFDRDSMPSHLLSAIVQVHPRILMDQRLYINPLHRSTALPPHEDQDSSHLDWLLSLIEEAHWGSEAREMIAGLKNRVSQRDFDVKMELMRHLETQRRLVKLNRLYQTLSQINSVIFRIRDRKRLLEEACRIAVDVGRFKLAWIGWVQYETGEVQNVASWGKDRGYIDSVRTSALDIPEGRGVVGTAIRLGRHAVCNDMETDPRQAPWREESSAIGLHSCAAFPLTVRGRVVGIVCIYSGQREYFNNEELRLLDDMAADISIALQSIDDEEQRRLTEAALKESESRFRRLAENAQDAIYRYELVPEPHYSYVSPACTRIIGYSPEEYLADPGIVRRLVHPDDRPLLEKMAARQRQGLTTTLRWIHKDGRELTIEQRDVPVFDDDGNLIAIEGIARDVTQNKKLEEQLLRAQRLEAAGRIAGQVAHDFNNLLGPLTAYPELIKMQLPAEHPFQSYCDSMLLAAQQMADINEDMMAMARRGHLREARTDLNVLMERVLEQLQEAPATLEVKADFSPELLPIRGSGSQLMRVLVNLVSNAREAMNDQGTLSLSTENVYLDRPVPRYNSTEFGEYVRVSVSDTGCGIPREIIDKVFDAFFSTKASVGRRGCGLGLSVVHNITEDHRGYVEFSSEIDKGTTFSLYFPAFRDAPELGTGDLTPLGSERILLVDDDELQREVVGQMLATLGYAVHVAPSGEEAVEFLRKDGVDLVILDMVMPGIDGAETYRRISKIRPGQAAILISGCAEMVRMEQALSMGVRAYLRKPLTMSVLAQAVREQFPNARTH